MARRGSGRVEELIMLLRDAKLIIGLVEAVLHRDNF